MNFKSYSFNIILRILLLAASMLAFIYALYQEKWYVTSSVTGLLVPVFIYSLISYTYNFRRDLSMFLMAIKNKEYSQFQKHALVNRMSELDQAFQAIAKELQDVSIEKESHYHYLQAMVENIDTGIISYKSSGEIHLFNHAAKKLLNMPLVRNIETIEKYHPSLYSLIKSMRAGERNVLTLTGRNELFKIAIQIKEFKQYGVVYKLISLQDIRAELDAQELESYQKLIQVLRHEIMNSATPISSLSEAVRESIEEILNQDHLTPDELNEELNDLLISVRTIDARTKGLLRFVNTYRKLTNIPQPSIDDVDLKELIHHSIRLLDSKIKSNNIRLSVELPKEELDVQGDFDQIEQVTINILLNAIEAVADADNRSICISGEKHKNGSVKVRFKDNGKGISKEEVDKIFIPFYTTKKEGSGIGLSFARKIMKLHRGDIQLYSQPGEGATCELYFE
jgi:nitrogen fixation/metabolism regulation signal transduction histidine kinase